MKFLVRFILALIVCASCPSRAAESGRPNILFIIFDDWNGSTHAGAYGCDWIKTPNFDRVAREGVLFKNAFTSNPKCSPCRASILTGRNTWQLKEAVSHGGYFPGGLRGRIPTCWRRPATPSGSPARAGGRAISRRWPNARAIRPGRASTRSSSNPPPRASARTTTRATSASSSSSATRRSRSVSGWAFTSRTAPTNTDSGVRLGKKLEDVKVPAFLPDTEIVRRDLLDYAVEVEWGDAQIGRALKVLEDAGRTRQHARHRHVRSRHAVPVREGADSRGRLPSPAGHALGQAAIKPGRVVEDFINVRDFAPTYMELAGLKPHPQMTGKSLVEHPALGEIGLDREPRRHARRQGAPRHRPAERLGLSRCAPSARRSSSTSTTSTPSAGRPAIPRPTSATAIPSPTKEVIKALGGHFYDLSLRQAPARRTLRHHATIPSA